MASSFKTLLSNDIVTKATMLNEAIPITGSIISGTYADLNIKKFAHNMFEAVYDYPYASSSANHIFDLTYGYASGSAVSSSSNTDNVKKCQIYNQMAQVLAGFDENGNLRQFDEDGQLGTGAKYRSCVFLNFSRLLVKDEIKKGSFKYQYATAGANLTIEDAGAATSYKVNSPAGEYGILYITATGSYAAGGFHTGSNGQIPVGLIYYQAGVAVLNASTGSIAGVTAPLNAFIATGSIDSILGSSTITAIADGFRAGTTNIQFQNTTEINSTEYFCRADHNEFGYSSNKTFLSGSKIVVKQSTQDVGAVYVTKVGLYSADNALLACASLSEPIKRETGNTSTTFKLRLDY